MKSDCERLFAEISEIATQYQREVPSGRRAWPESIRSRVFELRKSGVRSAEISRRTGLPYYTVLQWKGDGPKFVELPVRVRSAKSATVTVPARREVGTVTVPDSSGLRILLPGGAVIEGLDVEALARLLPALGVGR